MSERLLDRIKPAAPMRAHLILAAAVWTVVGLALAGAGLHWVLGSTLPDPIWLLVAAVTLGLVKAFVLLDRTGSQTVARIQARGDGRCLGGFISPGSWALVVGMMLGGRALRAWILPPGWAGLLYVAVGVALFTASRRIWLAVARAGADD